jgi:hypothetical protein
MRVSWRCWARHGSARARSPSRAAYPPCIVGNPGREPGGGAWRLGPSGPPGLSCVHTLACRSYASGLRVKGRQVQTRAVKQRSCARWAPRSEQGMGAAGAGGGCEVSSVAPVFVNLQVLVLVLASSSPGGRSVYAARRRLGAAAEAGAARRLGAATSSSVPSAYL